MNYQGWKTTRVKDLPEEDRPREKLIKFGAKNLSDSELIAILLRTGGKDVSVLELAQRLIRENRNIAGLVNKSVEELSKTKGIGNDKAATLVAAFEIARRVQMQSKWLSDTKITEPRILGEILIPLLRDELKEKFMVACLNRANKLITVKEISVGSLNESVVHPREVFKAALEASAASIALVHNHPSGNNRPSEADINLTKKLKEAGNIFEIPVLDHIIIAGNNYFSFLEENLL